MDPDVTTQVREYSTLFIPTDELSKERLVFVCFRSRVQYMHFLMNLHLRTL